MLYIKGIAEINLHITSSHSLLLCYFVLSDLAFRTVPSHMSLLPTSPHRRGILSHHKGSKPDRSELGRSEGGMVGSMIIPPSHSVNLIPQTSPALSLSLSITLSLPYENAENSTFENKAGRTKSILDLSVCPRVSICDGKYGVRVVIVEKTN
jgi:hypothetical protein